MKYMLLIYGDENALNADEMRQCYVESTQVANDLHAEGKFLDTGALHHSSKTASVRVRDGQRLVTDGPFTETHEQLGGFFLVDAKDQNEAIELAGRIPGARRGIVEVRPVVELSGLPEV
ncbi:YciI family protein [Fimbriimonas ginsengisoli]|uniref:YCII-like protein n=1 Tax=Fimbriimonas ginsengisoli Gsoil 348 TaxID=661478 RepID=A0A068NX02_FIMGI|nr:YciI family protein [Fimbriimonas ginsengisoli]AIE87966.1 YCII-like protein [Fimbriimonas ginsengisoli Gsoil 348]